MRAVTAVDEKSHASAEDLVVRAAQRGDRAAWARLHERYARMVHAILLAKVPRSEADDLVQDVFVTAMGRLATLRDAAAFGGWLAQIARNRVVDYHRQKRETSALDEEVAGHANTAEAAEAREVLAAIRKLPDAYRETLLMRLVEGMTGPEIAEQSGLTPESVRVNLHRGMKLLRRALGAETDEAGDPV